MKKLILPVLIVLCALAVDSCSSGKQAFEKGNYDEAVLKAINRLRKSPNNKKAAETLSESYPLTIRWHEDNIARVKSSIDEFKWERVVAEYQQINNLYNQLSRCPACLRIVPNAVSYQGPLNQAREQAAEIRYAKGEQLLARAKETHNRNEAREAYQHYAVSANMMGEYKDIRDKMAEAKWIATLKVLVEPIPMHSRNLQISNEFFENKILEFLETMPVNEFVQFYSAKEAKNIGLEHPDQIIQLQFDDFVLGQVYLKEKEIQMIKDSVVLAVIKAHHGVATDDALAANDRMAGLKYLKSPEAVIGFSPELNTARGNKKVAVCHKVPNSLGVSNTILISENALQHHLDHGDVQGACSGDTAPQEKEESDEDTSGNTSGGSSGDTSGNASGSDQNNTDSNNSSGTSTSGSSGQQSSGDQSQPDQSQGDGQVQEDNQPTTTKVYGTVKATMHIFNKTLTSKGLMDFKIIDAHSKRVLSQEKMPGEFIWYTEWGYFNGDERALDDYFIEITQYKEAQPPAPQDLFVAFTQPIYGQITHKIRNFYRNY